MFVMLAEVLIFVPSIASMRLSWLQDRLNTAAAAGVVIDGLQAQLPRSVQDDTLVATGARVIVLRKEGSSRLLAADDMPPGVDDQIDLADVPRLEAIAGAFRTLLFGGERIIRVFGPVGDSDMTIELVMNDTRLRKAMLSYAANVFAISLAISLMTGILLYVALNRMLVRPIRRLANNMQDFSDRPEDPQRVFDAGQGEDELSVAGRHLAAMQVELQKTLRQQKNLADLGMAVSKINHDMRNILSSAQLISDRLVEVDDPLVRNVAPKLLRTIDRAIGYTGEVLAYGQPVESAPRRRLVALEPLAHEVRDMLAIGPESGIEFSIRIPPATEVDADGEQLFRIVHNLCRNAVQALLGAESSPDNASRHVTISAQRIGDAVSITVDDNGPGMPQKARENLFAAFRGSARSGGTGLGLAIARELVLAHGGTIALVEKPSPGTRFLIEIPDRTETAQATRS